MKYEIPMLTDEQRGAITWFCTNALAETPEDADEVLMSLIAKITLAALTAEPVGYVSNISREIANDGGMGYISNHIVAGLEGGYVYTAPPVPALKLPDEIKSITEANNYIGGNFYELEHFMYGFNKAISEVKCLNGVTK